MIFLNFARTFAVFAKKREILFPQNFIPAKFYTLKVVAMTSSATYLSKR